MKTNKELNDEWLKLNDDMGEIFAREYELKQRAKKITQRMKEIDLIFDAQGLNTPITWEMTT